MKVLRKSIITCNNLISEPGKCISDEQCKICELNEHFDDCASNKKCEKTCMNKDDGTECSKECNMRKGFLNLY